MAAKYIGQMKKALAQMRAQLNEAKEKLKGEGEGAERGRRFQEAKLLYSIRAINTKPIHGFFSDGKVLDRTQFQYEHR